MLCLLYTSGSEAMNFIQIPTLNKKDDLTLNRIHHLLPGQVTLKDNEFATGIYTGTLYQMCIRDRLQIVITTLKKQS